MSIVLRLSILLIVLSAVVIVRPTCAYACSCRPPGTPIEALGQSDAVFQGTIVSVKASTGPVTSSADNTTVMFQVSKVWKGQITQTSTLTTPGSSASCGVTFEQGKEYVVYGRVNEGSLTTNLCSRTRAVADATEDMTAFGAGQQPTANTQAPAHLPATSTDMLSNQQPLLLIFAMLTIAVGMVVIAMSRRIG